MCERERPIPTEGLDRILKFLPILEETKHKFCVWPEDSGSMLSGPSYSEEVLAFLRTLYEGRFIIQFDWPNWQQTAERLISHPELLMEADLATLQKLLTTHVRKDRFCAGHLESILANGHIFAVLRRLQAIRMTLSDSS